MGKTLKYIFVFIVIAVVGFEIGYLSDQIDFSRLLSGWQFQSYRKWIYGRTQS